MVNATEPPRDQPLDRNQPLDRDQPLDRNQPLDVDTAVAIVGIGVRVPGASSPEELWAKIAAGWDGSVRFSAEKLASAGVQGRGSAGFVPVRAPLTDALQFDAAFFGMPAAEAARTDPQHRWMLQSAWHALCDAACDPARFDGTIGVFAGCSASGYGAGEHEAAGHRAGGTVRSDSVASSIALDRDFLATRVAYKLDLRGPALDVQTACSTSLVAVHLAVSALQLGQCDLALAGGVSIAAPVVGGHVYAKGGIVSEDGACRPFSDDADGCFGGDGVGVVALRRLPDALEAGDRIYAVIRATAVNNDGREKAGFTAPAIAGQAEVIRNALDLAEVDAATIGLMEAHGTATRIGDPIEVAALTDAYRDHTDDEQYCALGSIKANIGHLNACAGVVGLIKAALAVHSGTIPPSRNFRAANPALSLATSPFYVPQSARPWPAALHPRRAAVSSFGIGGTNAHAVLEQAPLGETLVATSGLRGRSMASKRATAGVLAVSAHDSASLQRRLVQLGRWLDEHTDVALGDVATTLDRHPELPSRAVVCAPTTDAARAALQKATSPRVFQARASALGTPSIVAMVSGQGGQEVGLAKRRYTRDAAFAEAMDDGFAAFSRHTDTDLKRLLFADPALAGAQSEQLTVEALASPINFIIGRALLLSWLNGAQQGGQGVRIDALLGHSLGEWVAAHVAGVFDLDAAARLIATRSRAIAELPAGGAWIVAAPASTVRAVLPAGAYIGVDNGPAGCLVSAATADLDAVSTRLQRAKLRHRRLRMSFAPHCPLAEPVAAALLEALQTETLRPPQIELWSPACGGRLSSDDALDPRHWARIAAVPVQFGAAAAAVLGADTRGSAPMGARNYVVAEIGPHRSIAPLVDAIAPETPVIPTLWPVTLDDEGDDCVRDAMNGMLWAAGIAAADDVHGAHAGTSGARGKIVSLPPYPFATTEYGPTPTQPADYQPQRGANRAALRPNLHPRPPLATPFVAPRDPVESAIAAVVEELLGVGPIGRDDSLFELGADSLVTLRITGRVEQELGRNVPAAAAFAGLSVASIRDALGEEAPDGGDLSDEAPDRCLVTLRSQGDRPPLFLVHPAAGVIFPYFELARCLGADQPVYALQAHGLRPTDVPDPDVVTMAQRYVTALLTVAPTGPVAIVGYSFGCYIAFEMARLLRNQNVDVRFLGLLDESAPLDGHRPTALMMSRLLVGEAGKAFRHHFADYLALSSTTRASAKPAHRAAKTRRSRRDRAQQWLRTSAMATLLPTQAHAIALDQPAMTPMFRLFRQHVQLTFRHTASGTYDGDATLFLSDWTVNRPTWVQRDPDPTFGWREVVGGHVQIRRAPGDHLGMIRQPHVAVLADLMRSEMDAAQAKADRK